MVTSIINLSLPVDDPNRVIQISGYQAEGYSETPSQPNFESIDIDGRSSPIAYYSGGSARTVSFSMLFHRDMVAPWTSAVDYAGQPGGIETSADSPYSGLYLGENSDRLDQETMIQRFIDDYLKYNNTVINQETGGVVSIDPTSVLQPNQKAFYTGNQTIIATYDENGKLISTRTNPDPIKMRTSFTALWNKSNAIAEADATARFHLFLNKLKALNYPVYTPSGIIPPMVYLKIGGDAGIGGIRLKGYCNVSINYDGIVKHNSLISTTVDFSFTEVVDIAWSAPEIINNMQRYVQWMDPMVR